LRQNNNRMAHGCNELYFGSTSMLHIMWIKVCSYGVEMCLRYSPKISYMKDGRSQNATTDYSFN